MDATYEPSIDPHEVRKPERKLRLYAYLRVSSKEQLEGNGLAIQRQACEVWCQRHGCDLAGVYSDEGVSGTTAYGDREGLGYLWSMLGLGQADGLIVYKMDRLARDLMVQEGFLRDLWADGLVIRSTFDSENEQLQPDTDDPMRKLMRQMLGAIADYERGMIALRMRRGRAVKSLAGFYVGGRVPYGCRLRDDGALEDDPAERAAVNRMVELREAGNNWNRISRIMDEEGFRNRVGKTIGRVQIQKVVERVLPLTH